MPSPSGHYFDTSPSAPSSPRSLPLVLPDMALELVGDRGVFSSDRIDPGTLVLLEQTPRPPQAGHILDLGCGYGPIALAAARRAPEARVWAVDVNKRALELTLANALRLNIPNVVTAAPEDVAAEVRFAAVYSNPPIRIGKAALHELLERWLDRLEPDGRAYLVVQKHLGSDSLARWLEDRGFPTRRMCSKRSYRVFEVQPRALP